MDLNAGLALHGRSLVATNYTLTTNDLYVGVTTIANTNLVLTLPSAATASNLFVILKDEGGAGATNTLKIFPQTGDRIDGLTNLVVSNNYGGVMLRSRGGTNYAVIATGGGVTGGVASSGGSVPLTNSVWVAKNGSDSTGTRGDPAKAYLTLRGAWTNAVSGDTIFVMPGTYNEKNLLKNGVNWHFFSGAVVNYTGAANGSVFDDGGNGANAAVTSTITGSGVFTNAGSAGWGVVSIENASAVTIQCARMIGNGFTVTQTTVATNYLTISGAEIIGQNWYAVDLAGSGDLILDHCYLTAQSTFGNGAAIYLEGYYANNTNCVLRDCVVLGNDSASSPVVIKSDSAGAKVRIEGSLTSNLGLGSDVTFYDDRRTTVGGILQNNVINVPTNTAPFTIDAADFALDTYYTNSNQRAFVSASVLLSANAADTAQVSLYLDQDADTAFEQTGIAASATGLVTNSVPLTAWIQPGGVFVFTNLSTGSATAAVNTGSSQFVKQ
jgi:hypothetical protein